MMQQFRHTEPDYTHKPKGQKMASLNELLEGAASYQKSLFNEIFFNLRRDILTGKLMRGEKLTEKKLCEEYEVSRTPIRESLRQLEEEGLVENIPNRGSFVTGLSPENIRDIFLIKKNAEIPAVRWAVERITGEELDQIEEVFNFMVFYTRKNDVAKMIDINGTFHTIIYKATHNRILERQLSAYQTYIRYALPASYFTPGYMDILLEEHRAIYSAFLTGDPEAGEQAARTHLEQAYIRHYGHN